MYSNCTKEEEENDHRCEVRRLIGKRLFTTDYIVAVRGYELLCNFEDSSRATAGCLLC